MTRQRRAVLNALAGAENHPTAAEVYERVRERLPNVSQGTVYRNLRKLIELGYAQELPYGPGASHFDTTIEPHYHLRCVDCGRVVDLPIDEEAAPCLEEARKAAEGWTVSRQRVEFTGHCPDCREDQ